MEETKKEYEPPELNLVAYSGEGNESKEITVGLWRRTKNGKEYFSGKAAMEIPSGARIYLFKNTPKQKV